MRRRDLLITMLCAGSLGFAEWLRPREDRLLLPAGQSLATIIPAHFGRWRIDPNGNIVMPPTEGSLADQLYDELLVRTYVNSADNLSPVMMLATYGRKQSDGLQLHRPESCYPAVGFAIVYRKLGVLAIDDGVEIPVVRLTAQLGERVEDIVYWTRLGESLPRSAGEQRRARLEAAMAGYIGDGVLIRASAVRTGTEPAHHRIDDLLRSLLLAVNPGWRAALAGSACAARLRRSNLLAPATSQFLK